MKREQKRPYLPNAANDYIKEYAKDRVFLILCILHAVAAVWNIPAVVYNFLHFDQVKQNVTELCREFSEMVSGASQGLDGSNLSVQAGEMIETALPVLILLVYVFLLLGIIVSTLLSIGYFLIWKSGNRQDPAASPEKGAGILKTAVIIMISGYGISLLLPMFVLAFPSGSAVLESLLPFLFSLAVLLALPAVAVLNLLRFLGSVRESIQNNRLTISGIGFCMVVFGVFLGISALQLLSAFSAVGGGIVNVTGMLKSGIDFCISLFTFLAVVNYRRHMLTGMLNARQKEWREQGFTYWQAQEHRDPAQDTNQTVNREVTVDDLSPGFNSYPVVNNQDEKEKEQDKEE